ncbi:MAG: thioredoxin domain-containing protein, partial [Pseudomonadota bacterium]
MNSHPKNRLASESSAYLKQHSSNPVDWYPWGPEALQKAKKENKPIFLSIGYSACHWCHVMERESFEDLETAEILKKHFVSIKVDREERPDLDHIYMAAVQALTHRGGWPLTVFLTPALQPFYGGTYFPPQDRMGMPSFKKLLLGIAQAWKNRPQDLIQSAVELTQALQQMSELGTHSSGDKAQLTLSDVETITARAYQAIQEKVDQDHGGMGSAPKFFHTMDWKVVLRHWKNSNDPESLSLLENTLDHWSRGGIYDQLGGGFHRYSTDRVWLAPHFEKMLYDNALVPQVFLEAFQATRRVEYARTVRETLYYVMNRMTDPLGGYFSTEDADSEGEEGKFYVWNKAEIEKILGTEAATIFCEAYGVSQKGNWEGVNILHLPKPLDPFMEDSLAKSKRLLFGERAKRIAPHRDEKIILAWNGLMIETMARAHQVLDAPAYLESARNCALFVKNFLQKSHSQLYHSFQDGKPYFNAYLDDYAYFING